MQTNAAAPVAPSGSPVAVHGKLSIRDGKLHDQAGRPYALHGVSTAGIQWFGQAINDAAFAAIALDWKVDAVRLAFYVGEGGYATSPTLRRFIDEGIRLAVKYGIYVLVDWHVLTPGDPNDPVYSGAQAFFDDVSKTYGSLPNVLYEIMNEPNGPVDWLRDLKPWAQKTVATIRHNDPDNLILIGSGTWSQDIDVAAADPVAGSNLAYTFHFYAGTHGADLRAKVQRAIDRGVAVFCSEWGTSSADGDGGPFFDASKIWLDFLDQRGISWINWSMANTNQVSSLFRGIERTTLNGSTEVTRATPLVPDVRRDDGLLYWPAEQLSASGAWVRARLLGLATPVSTVQLPCYDFENGLQGWAIADDSPVQPIVSLVKIGSTSALTVEVSWSDRADADAWASAPRIRRLDIGAEVGTAKALAFDVYVQGTLTKPISIVPVLQYPPTWWSAQSPAVISPDKGSPVGGYTKFSLKIPISVTADAVLGHLVLVVLGTGSGYAGTIAFDNIRFVDADGH